MMIDVVLETLRGKATDIVVTPGLQVKIIAPTSERNYHIFSVQTMRQTMTTAELETAMQAGRHFLASIDEACPAYLCFDVASIELMSASQIQTIASFLREIRSDVEVKIVGSVCKTDTKGRGLLATFLANVYKPVRPICWSRRDEDAITFIQNHERELFGM